MTVPFDELGFGGRAVYLPEFDTAAVSDLHVGFEEEARASGMSLPLREKETLEEGLREVLVRFSPETVVFNGDIHHSFGELGDSGRTIRRLRSVVESTEATPVFIEGNHDTMLEEVVETQTWYSVGGDNESRRGDKENGSESGDGNRDADVVFVHGDTVPPNLPDAPLYVVGHDHPAVEIELQKEPCFLYGPFRDSHVLMTPAFNPLCEGVVVNEMYASDLMSPFVRESLNAFRVVVETDEEVLRFPEMREFRRML